MVGCGYEQKVSFQEVICFIQRTMETTLMISMAVWQGRNESQLDPHFYVNSSGCRVGVQMEEGRRVG